MNNLDLLDRLRRHDSGWVEASNGQFYAAVNPLSGLDLRFTKTNWPFATDWVSSDQVLVGKSVIFLPLGTGLHETAYFLPKPVATPNPN
jgi:hypothetical protein